MQNPFDPGYFGSEELRSLGLASAGHNVRIAKNCTIIGLENIEIGDNVRIDAFSRIVANGPLKIGSYVHVHTGCLLGCRGGITLGDYVSISHDSRLITATDDLDGRVMVGGVVPSEFTSPTVAPIHMGDHSGTCMNVSILPGVTIGTGSIVLVHALVTRALGSWGLFAGTPARRVRARERNVLELQARIEGYFATA